MESTNPVLSDKTFSGVRAYSGPSMTLDGVTFKSGVLLLLAVLSAAFSWSAVSGRIYSVYWSTNLMNGFQPLETNILYPQNSYTNATPDPRVNYYQLKVRMQ